MNSIDLFIAVIMVLAIYKGYSNGLIMAVVSVIAWIFGWMLAIKLSSSIVSYLGDDIANSKMGPIIAFVLVFIGISVAIIFIGRLVNTALKAIMLGWANRLAGVAIYILGAGLMCSGFLWLTDTVSIMTAQKQESKLYPIIQPIAPAFAENTSTIFPVLSNSYNSIKTTIDTAIPNTK